MARHTLSAEQTARRLGVKLATVYAYVSRGILSRRLGSDGRTSRFELREVEELAQRGRPRKGVEREGAFQVTIATSITGIRDDRLQYRGHDAAELAARTSFERVAELLWTGTLPETAAFSVPDEALRVAEHAHRALPETSGFLERLSVATAALAAAHPLRVDLRADAVTLHARRLLATFPRVLPRLRERRGAARERYAARLFPCVSALPPTDARVALLDATLVLLADHELATSTLAARVAASTRADPFAVVLAGLGAISGPLHGKAAVRAHRMILDATSGAPPEAAIARTLEESGFVPGFGHPVYTGVDPRAAHLLARVRELGPSDIAERLDALARVAAKTAGGRENVDFGLGAVAVVLDMPVGATEGIFAIARTAGFVAHALEEYAQTPLRFRARSIYVGQAEA